MPSRKTRKVEDSPFRLLLWTTIAGLIFGLIGFGELPEDLLRAGRNSLHWNKASGDIVLVKIDDQSLREIGRWPWPRRRHAELTDALTQAGAKRIFFDIAFPGETEPAEDRLFADSLRRSGRVTLAAKVRFGPNAGAHQDTLPLPMLERHTSVGSISVQYNYQNAVWRVPYSAEVAGKPVGSFAALLAERPIRSGSFIPDYSVDPATIPTLSASDVIGGRTAPEVIRGKDVVIGTTSDQGGDKFFLPGTGKMGGAYVHIIAAETLKAGNPVYLGWVPLFLVSLGFAAAIVFSRLSRHQAILLGGGAAALLLGPAALEANLIYADVTPGLFLLLCLAAALVRRRFRQGGLVNAVSGLPNLNALRADRSGRDKALIVGRILNYAEIVATLPADREREVVEQIIGRLSVGGGDRTFYHGDDGIFAWFEEPRKPFGHHIEALHALFRSPIHIAQMPIDLSISFGVEIGSNRSLANRLGSAMVAADEAAHYGLKWKYHDPESLQDASWKLSMLSQLDAAVEKGEIWVAYQPKLDLASGRIVGAEALARWTHPEKGPIAASEFIAAAEQHDRIGKLTDFVLDQALRAASKLGRQQPGFGVAVNLSARLLDDRGFTLRLSAMLARYGVAPERLTLELTETAALADNGLAVDALVALRDLGIVISIDDYGTGLSTLDYLKKIPASEIKIDQSFVRGMLDTRSDMVMVQSTIALAHSLGRKVVAEGVERREALKALTEMGCNVAQGFAIGRPMSLDSLAKRLASQAGVKTA